MGQCWFYHSRELPEQVSDEDGAPLTKIQGTVSLLPGGVSRREGEGSRGSGGGIEDLSGRKDAILENTLYSRLSPKNLICYLTKPTATTFTIFPASSSTLPRPETPLSKGGSNDSNTYQDEYFGNNMLRDAVRCNPRQTQYCPVNNIRNDNTI